MTKSASLKLPGSKPNYPRPGDVGGRLIRRVISFLRGQGVGLPISGPLLVAVSGGSDSLALALLLARYGRRIFSGPLYLVHFEHGWSSVSSALSAIVDFGRRQGVAVIVQKLPVPQNYPRGVSWEDYARNLRYSGLEILRQRIGATWVMTAHQQEDLAESVLWALCTGNAAVRGGGILAQSGQLLRPLLGTSKAELQAFLREENQQWIVDTSNADPRFLRARLRLSVFPALQEIFPRAIEHLSQLGIQAQEQARKTAGSPLSRVEPGDWLWELSQTIGVRLRASHFGELKRTGSSVFLPEGWILKREGPCQNFGKHPIESQELWVLQKSEGGGGLPPRR